MGSQGVTPANKGMISYKMWTIVLLVCISHQRATVDAIPLPQRMLEEGSYLIIPIGGGLYDTEVQDLADGMFSRTQRGAPPPSSPDPVATRHIRGIKSPYDRAALRTIGR